MTCHACGATLPGTARFCHKCGAAVAAPSQGSAGWQAGLPWAVAGAAVGALLTVVALRLGSSSGGGMRESGGVGDGPAPAARIPAPDISQMSPPEHAPRLRRLPALRDRRAGPPPPRVRRAPEHDRCLSRGGTPGHGRQVLVTLPPSPFPTPGLRTIRVAHSPDADDAFMFWAMTSGRIATGARRYVHELADIESLNRRALAGELECTAVSFHAYAHLADRHALLAHGAAVGDRYGPRVVARAR